MAAPWFDGFDWSVFACIFGVYALSAAPSVAGGDSGEILAEACAWGTAHPPGYPLLTMLFHYIMRLPHLCPAHWANVACGACGALAAVAVGKTALELGAQGAGCVHRATGLCRRRASGGFHAACKADPLRRSGRRWAGAGGAALYAFSPLAWQYSATAEVFAMNNLLCAGLVYCAVRYAKRDDRTALFAGALLCGLALSNQHTAVLFEVPLVLWMVLLLRRRSAAFQFDLLKLGLVGLVGLVPYAYLPISATLAPHRGAWGDVTNWSGFLRHVRRADYGSLRLYSGNDADSEGLEARVRAYLNDITRTQAPQGCMALLAALGAAAVLVKDLVASGAAEAASRQTSKAASKKKKGTAVATAVQPVTEASSDAECACALFCTWAFYVFIFHSLANLPLHNALLFGVHARFWMQPNLVVCVFATLGLDAVACGGGCAFKSPTVRKIIAVQLAVVVAAAQLRHGLLNGGAPGGPVMESFGLKPASFYFHDYAKAILAPLPTNAVLLINYDQQWTSVRYVQECEGFRSDVTVLNLSMMTYAWWQEKRKLYPELEWPGTFYTKENTVAWRDGAFTIAEFLKVNVEKHSFFLGGKLSYDDATYKELFEFLPHGLVSRLASRHQPPPLEGYVEETRRAWNSTLAEMRRLPRLKDHYDEQTWEWTIQREVFDHAAERAAYILERAIDAEPSPMRQRHLFEAAIWLEYCLAYDLNPPTSVAKNLGLVHVHLVRSQNADALGFVPDILGETQLLNETMHTIKELYPAAYGAPPADESVAEVERFTGFGTPRALGPDWKSWSSTRFTVAWADFLSRDDAQLDPQYDTIVNIYTSVTKKAPANKKPIGRRASA